MKNAVLLWYVERVVCSHTHTEETEHQIEKVKYCMWVEITCKSKPVIMSSQI